MPILTTAGKSRIIRSFHDDVADAGNHYYIAIGRSLEWDDDAEPPAEKRTLREEWLARLAMQSIKKVDAVSLVADRNVWSNGAVYQAWSNSREQYANAYFVVNEQNQVYVCVIQGKDANGNAAAVFDQPIGGNAGNYMVETDDGYVWRYLYSISPDQAASFVSANVMPVALQAPTTSNSSLVEIDQYNSQQGAVPGQILGYEVMSGGSGYTSAPTITVAGDGTGAAATARVVGGVVVDVTPERTGPALYGFGMGYNAAKVTVTGGGAIEQAVVTPVFAPRGGLGADPRNDLRARFVAMSVKVRGDEAGDFVVGNDFRQTVLLRNPRTIADNNGDTSPFTDSTGRAMNALEISTVTGGAFGNDEIFEGTTTNARARLVFKDGDNYYYTQDEETGFGDFEAGETIREIAGGSAAGTVDSIIPAEFDRFSGDLLELENHLPIDRRDNQNEDLRIVVGV